MMMLNSVFAYRPQYTMMQQPAAYSITPLAQNMLPSSYGVQASYGYGAQPQMTLFSQAPAPSAGWGNWMAPMTQFAGNMFSFGQSALTGLGQASAGLFGSMWNGINSGNAGYMAMRPPVMQLPVMQYATSALQSPQPMMQIMRDMGTGARQAVQQMGGILRDNAPAALAMGGTMLASTAVCSFMGGALVGTAGIMMAQHMMSGAEKPHP